MARLAAEDQGAALDECAEHVLPLLTTGERTTTFVLVPGAWHGPHDVMLTHAEVLLRVPVERPQKHEVGS